jgi:cytosine/adenosine deaminase-related metal-dependent hydrolase
VVAQHVNDLKRHPSLVGGISPHAPYSVAPQLFRDLVEHARTSRVPLAVHLAETPDELELLANGSGPLVDLFSESGFWRSDAIPRGTIPLHYLWLMDSLPRALIIHGNYLTAEECDFLAGKPNLTVVYCPRTHAHFRHEPHPWIELQKRGAHVALGTDSRASNPDLSLWNEVQFLRSRFPQVAPATLLELATQAGASALGLGWRVGTLTPGKAADMTLVRLAGDEQDNPYERLLDPASQPVETMRDGYWISLPIGR